MLKALRWRLTLLYLLAAVGLVVVLDGGAYWLVVTYFNRLTDQALGYRMALAFNAYGLPLSADLQQARAEYQSNLTPQPGLLPVLRAATPTPDHLDDMDDLHPSPDPAPAHVDDDDHAPTRTPARRNDGDHDGDDDDHSPPPATPTRTSAPLITSPTPALIANITATQPAATPVAIDLTGLVRPISDTLPGAEAYDPSLASIFVLPLDQNGALLAEGGGEQSPLSPDRAGYQAALQHGADWRDVRLANGERARLFSYRTGLPQGPAVLQAGRLLSDQDRTMRQILLGLALLGLVCVTALGLGSWWLAGRTIGPAQKAMDQQQQFVSNASHELRTPLTLIRATADYALRQQPPPAPAEALHQVVDETDYMSRLVDDLLLLSRLDARKLKLELEPVDLAELLPETAERMARVAGEQGLRLELGVAGGAVRADATRLRQVLLIVLDNAVRHTPASGTIRLEAARQGRQVQVKVSDTGEGIPEKHLPHVFERFYQVEPGSNENRSSGLGLSIARGLIEAMGGEIRLESRSGQGTTVTIQLPAVPEAG